MIHQVKALATKPDHLNFIPGTRVMEAQLPKSTHTHKCNLKILP